MPEGYLAPGGNGVTERDLLISKQAEQKHSIVIIPPGDCFV
jgi:hypothetical protein